MTLPPPMLIAGACGALLELRADLQRRRLSLSRSTGWHFFTVLDVICPATVTGGIIALGVAATPFVLGSRSIDLTSPITWQLIAGVLIVLFTWQEGRRQIQFQRPPGIVLAETLILVGAYQLADTFFSKTSPWPGITAVASAMGCSTAVMVAGIVVLAIVVPPMMKRYEGHRVLEHLAEQGESVQVEYTPPTPECPHPERWHMVDTKSTELEVIEFLKSVVTTVKPQLIVETGTFLGYGSLRIAAGLQENGFGKLITIEHDPAVFAKAKERIDASGLGKWIEYRNESSLETRIEGMIDVLFSDSYGPIREQEVRRFLPQIDPRGLILVHDAGSHFGVVREAMLRLEREGLISTVLLSTPRGLAIAQKREGRK